MIEADFQAELKKALIDAGCKCDKFPDLARAVKKPYDLAACIHGRYVAIECKLRKVGAPDRPARWGAGMLVLKPSDVRPGQHSNLRQVVNAGGVAVVVVGIYDLGDGRRDALFVPYERLFQFVRWDLGDIPAEWKLPWIRGRGWNVQNLVDFVTKEG